MSVILDSQDLGVVPGKVELEEIDDGVLSVELIFGGLADGLVSVVAVGSLFSSSSESLAFSALSLSNIIEFDFGEKSSVLYPAPLLL